MAGATRSHLTPHGAFASSCLLSNFVNLALKNNLVASSL